MFQARRVAVAIYPDERPDRAARLWLALAVATLWMVSVGGALEVGPDSEATALPDLRPLLGGHRGDARPTAPPPVVAPGLVVVPGVSDHHREACHCRNASSQSPGRKSLWGYWWLLSIRTPWNTMRYKKVYPQKRAGGGRLRTAGCSGGEGLGTARREKLGDELGTRPIHGVREHRDCRVGNGAAVYRGGA